MKQLHWSSPEGSCPVRVSALSSELTVLLYGSASTAPSLSAVFYLLASYADDMEIIRQELSTVDVEDAKAVALLPHLNGAINEAMRLLPAFMTAGTRVTPPEGLMIGETFIPGDVKIAAPRYSLGRSELPILWGSYLFTDLHSPF